MRKNLNIALSIVVWCALVAYLLFAVRLCSSEQGKVMLTSVDIRILGDAKERVITPEIVSEWLTKDGYDFANIEINRVNTEQIRKSIKAYSFVKEVKIYTEMSGRLAIDIIQRRPIARIASSNGYNFYISDDDWILPIQIGQPTYVPIITGGVPLPFSADFSGSIQEINTEDQINYTKNHLYLLNLIKFVKTINSDPFWSSQIVQINLKTRSSAGAEGSWREPDIELITRVGRQVVLFGGLDDVSEKLEKLMTFYTKALNYEGWDEYRTINLKYKNQVVCRH